jgi:FkbM family methyltransferase
LLLLLLGGAPAAAQGGEDAQCGDHGDTNILLQSHVVKKKDSQEDHDEKDNGDNRAARVSHNMTMIKPPWPGKSFKLACPAGTAANTCTRLGSPEGIRSGCFEPEAETQEVLNSFLLECPGCLYIDIGCNIGYFAAHAAALGASVECFEPVPNYIHAVKATQQFNGMGDRFNVHHAAVVPDSKWPSHLTFNKGYRACGMNDGSGDGISWSVPTISIRSVLSGQRAQLLKIDIDANEGALFHTVADMIMRNETSVDTILVEVGDYKSHTEWDCREKPCPQPSDHPRDGDIEDFQQLQHGYGYDLYRINIHVGREIFDWKGNNMDQHMAPQRKGVLSMYSVRSMRKLEKVESWATKSDVRDLFHAGTSFLLTREQLAEPMSHHVIDLNYAKLASDALNEGNPAFQIQ